MNIEIKNRICHINGHAVVKDNSDLKLTFSFDEEWEGKTKTARFVSDTGEIYSDVSIVDNECIIPISILEVGIIKIGVYNDTMSTLYASLVVLPSILFASNGYLPDTIPSGVVVTSDGYVIYTSDDYVVTVNDWSTGEVTEYVVTSSDNSEVYTSDDYLVTTQDID